MVMKEGNAIHKLGEKLITTFRRYIGVDQRAECSRQERGQNEAFLQDVKSFEVVGLIN